MNKVGLIGHPVSHSKSPLIHSHWIKKNGINANYQTIDTPPEMLQQTIDELLRNNFTGFNVTIPHKETMLQLCNTTDDNARNIGAVNTIIIKNGLLHGMNTDGFGFIENIKTKTPAFDFAAGPVAILGAGGAARAIVHALLQHNTPEIRIINRSITRAESLAADFKNLNVVPWGERSAALEGCNLLVNTTSLGMNGQPALDISLAALPHMALVCDIVYAPLMTGLLQCAAARGNPIATGIGMLLHQARPAFAAWFGVMPDVDEALEKMVLS